MERRRKWAKSGSFDPPLTHKDFGVDTKENMELSREIS